MKRSPSLAASLSLGLMAVFLLWQEIPPPERPLPPAAARGMPPPDSLRALTEPPPAPGRSGLRPAALTIGVLERAVEGNRFRLELPDGRETKGSVAAIHRDAEGLLWVQGTLDAPRPGRYFFQRQTADGVAGELAGHILFDGSPVGWKVIPAGPGGAPRLVESHEDRIVCVDYAPPPEGLPEEAPQSHPTTIPIPPYQAVIPLQSLPGATGVIYLDFDGEPGPFPGWGAFDAAPAPANNNQIFEVWKRVAEDFQGFNLNITTDRKVFDTASAGRRQHVVVTPTTTAAPTAGGVAYIGSYNWSESTVCWAFYSIGKSAAEVISHEVGHTLELSHDGRTSPQEGYYRGHGDGSTGWAPIMGVGYYENLTQWSKGEYAGANNPEDDLAVIVSNNDVDYRADDAGGTPATARHLEIGDDDGVAGEGIIERTGDVDAFRFATAGGPVVLNLSPVSAGPNLDLHAELVEASTGTIVASSNPDLAVTATLSESLAAGEYLLKIRGTGRGDPAGDGYSDYGSLGAYLVGGSVAGGVKPVRFAIAENSAPGTPVGTVEPRADHGALPLFWSITGGNDGGWFSVDPASGVLSVTAALDFEALSARWDDPAEIGLFVTITDTLDPELTEELRVVVAVEDVNEAPFFAAEPVTMLERTRPGTLLRTWHAEDPDRFQFPVFTIAGGNDGGWFAIDGATGELRVAATMEVEETTVVPLVIQVADQGAPARTSSAVVNLTVVDIAPGHEPGGLLRTYYEGIGGGSVSHLISSAGFPDRPDSEERIADFDGGPHGDYFGSTLRGYLIPPVSGSYRFWIASDDAGELRLSPTAGPEDAVAVASVSSWTYPHAWQDGGGQRSAWIPLAAGQPYYIEARHKDGGGADHVSVAWEGPGLPKQLLRGLFLAPFDQNYAPEVVAGTFHVQEDAFAGQEIGRVAVTDVNGEDVHGSFAITGGNPAGIFAIDPATGVLRVAAANLLDAAAQSVHALAIQVSDNGQPSLARAGTVSVQVQDPGAFVASGIYQQVWTGIPGTNLAMLTGNASYPHRPAYTRVLAGFDSGPDFADSYGSRIRARLVPPATGSYTFYLSSDDDSRLLLGGGALAAGAAQIASVSGYTGKSEWTKYASQASAPVPLVAGEEYYIEALHKDGGGSDHVRVGWTGPGLPEITVIPASALRPCDINEPPVLDGLSPAWSVTEGAPAGTVAGTVTASDPEGDSPILAMTGCSPPGAFAFDPATGSVTVSDSGAMVPGVCSVTLAAQDRGMGRLYPLKTSTTVIGITVISNNQAPAFTAGTLDRLADEDVVLAGSLAATDPDAGDLLIFSKSSGPAWLAVLSDGRLSGTPGNGEVGENRFLVRVTDPEGFFDEAELLITVANTNDPPRFPPPPLELPHAVEDLPYSASLSGLADDPDPDDAVAYSIAAGPGWLAMATDGTVSGTPSNDDVGLNVVVVRATDFAGSFADATLTLEVVNTNDPPVLLPFAMVPAEQDAAYSASLAAFAFDPDAGDGLVFSKISGPDWLVVAANGDLGGTPSNADAGDHTIQIRVTDAAGLFAEAPAIIPVANVNDPPAFLADPILLPGGMVEVAYTGPTLAGSATDPDPGELPVYAITAGPSWLALSPGGLLSGTPPDGSSGTNLFTVRATDPAGLFSEAALIIEIASAGLPLPWDEGAIGGVSGGGSGSDDGVLTLRGSGRLSGRSDGLYFVWQPLSGDGVITARLEAMADTGPDARAGVMIRDSLAANSRHVFMGTTGTGDYRWVRRTGWNGNTSTSSSGTGALPGGWLRLVRSGGTITAFKSTDGIAWITVGSLTAALPPTCYFGLAVAGGDSGIESSAVFTHVSVSP